MWLVPKIGYDWTNNGSGPHNLFWNPLQFHSNIHFSTALWHMCLVTSHLNAGLNVDMIFQCINLISSCVADSQIPGQIHKTLQSQRVAISQQAKKPGLEVITQALKLCMQLTEFSWKIPPCLKHFFLIFFRVIGEVAKPFQNNFALGENVGSSCRIGLFMSLHSALLGSMLIGKRMWVFAHWPHMERSTRIKRMIWVPKVLSQTRNLINVPYLILSSLYHHSHTSWTSYRVSLGIIGYQKA